MSHNLAIAGAVSLALYLLISVIQAFRRGGKVGCLGNFLTFVGILLMLGSLILGAGNDEPNPLTRPIILGSGAVVAVVSLVVYIMERRKDEFQPMFSRGALGLATGIILLIMSFFVPIIPQAIFPLPTSTPISVGLENATTIASNIVPTAANDDVTATPRLTLTPTITRTPLPSPSPTRTRRAYEPPTISPTPEQETVAEECDARVTVNLNVRSEPTTESEIVAIIPEGRFVRILGRGNEDNSDWWRTQYEGELGWVFGDLLELDPICLSS